MDKQDKVVKKKFNKRAYLKEKLKTNFGSRQEGHGRAFLQKKAVVRQYFRQQRREDEKNRKKLQFQQLAKGEKFQKLEPQSINALTKENSDINESASQQFRKKTNSWQQARAEYHKKIAEKEQMKEESAKRRKEIEEAKKKYQEKRLHRFKKLSQKTRKGQIVMSGRIELLLEQLEREMGS
nr:thyroid transcription factor 1-associated protein 26 homolog [Cherax quadricarinatus]